MCFVNIDHSGYKLCWNRYQSFLVLSICTLISLLFPINSFGDCMSIVLANNRFNQGKFYQLLILSLLDEFSSVFIPFVTSDDDGQICEYPSFLK